MTNDEATRKGRLSRLLATVPTVAIVSEAARRRRAMQTTPPTPEKPRPCPHCGEEFGARRLRKHTPACRRAQRVANQAVRGSRVTPETAATLVMERCRLSNPGLAAILAYRAEKDANVKDYSAWAEVAIAAYKDYQGDWGANSFFGSGRYLQRTEWDWRQ